MAEFGDFLGPLEPDRMTDTGMWIWAGLLTVGSLVASYFVAIAWQKWRSRETRGP